VTAKLPAAGPRLGIDVGGTKLAAAVLDPDGRERWHARVATPVGDYDGTVRAIHGLVLAAEAATGLQGLPVGLGTPGSQTADGLMRNANSTCLNGRPFAADLAVALRRPVRLANDANCLALSEAVDGAAAGAGSVFAVILGTGVGGGWVLNGRLIEGANGLAGEWGHNPLPSPTDDERPGPPCYCGRRGCLETWLSGPGIAADHSRRHPVASGNALTAPELVVRAAEGEAAARASFARHADRLARALGVVINLVNPDVIVLGGGVSRLPGLVEAVESRWLAHVFQAGPSAPLATRLVLSQHGDDSGVRGAARLWG
jgi:fructokinase